jgi:rhamnosyltransferase
MMLHHHPEWKGCEDGPQARSLVRKQDPDMRASFFGVPARPETLPDWIEYQRSPSPEQLRALYDRAAIFVAPNRTEGWGLTGCEALLCGAALVVTDIDGHRESVFDGQTALTSAARSPHALAENIHRLIQDPALRIQLTKNGCNLFGSSHGNVPRPASRWRCVLRYLKRVGTGCRMNTAAIVVTFHPRIEYIQNLAAVRAQVDLLIVVDNGSAQAQLQQLRSAAQDPGFILIENGENLGIAAALNLGVCRAHQEGCRWVALFDQDSVLTEGFVAAMVAEFRAYRQHKQIMQIVPRYVDPETGVERTVCASQDGGVFLSITSGSLFSMEAFERCGLFDEDLFIYCVDDDFSLRLRKQGFYIGVSKKAVLLHQSGHPTSRTFFGKTLTTKHYRPEVRYYYARNKVRILRSYGRRFPRLIIPTLREFVSIPVKIALMEDASWSKIKLFLRGLADGVAGRVGPLRQAD